MRDGKVELDDENAIATARHDFGWRVAQIREAILKLQRKHFYKTENHRFKRPELNIKVDYYKARDLMGEDVYIHLHVDENGWLIIDSFKRI